MWLAYVVRLPLGVERCLLIEYCIDSVLQSKEKTISITYLAVMGKGISHHPATSTSGCEHNGNAEVPSQWSNLKVMRQEQPREIHKKFSIAFETEQPVQTQRCTLPSVGTNWVRALWLNFVHVVISKSFVNLGLDVQPGRASYWSFIDINNFQVQICYESYDRLISEFRS